LSWRYLQQEYGELTTILKQHPVPPIFKTLILRNSDPARFVASLIGGQIAPDEIYQENSIYSPFNRSFDTIEEGITCAQAIREEKEAKPVTAYFEPGTLYRHLSTLSYRHRDLVQSLVRELPPYIGFFCLPLEGHFPLLKYEKQGFLLHKRDVGDAALIVKENIRFIKNGALSMPCVESGNLYLFMYVNQVLCRTIFGSRGYRIAVFECGILACYLKSMAEKCDMSLDSTTVFYDRQLQRFLGLDGRYFTLQAVLGEASQA